MTHMHIPDGVLPAWLWVAGLVLTAAALAASLVRVRSMNVNKKIPLLGAVTAAMLVVMTLEIFPLAYHINLSVVAGILLGPALGVIAAFIANLILAAMGHGGVTVMGLNTLLLASEAVLGHVLFHLFSRRLPVFWRASLATVVTLLFATVLLIGMVAVSHVDPELLLGHEEEAHGLGHEDEAHGGVSDSLAAFAAIVLSLGSIGWLLEGAITGAVVRFIAQVRPDLLGHRLHREQRPGPV